jgi:hypothetical protein
MSIDDLTGPWTSVAPVPPIFLKSESFVEVVMHSRQSFAAVSVSSMSTVSPICPDCMVSPTHQVSATGIFC